MNSILITTDFSPHSQYTLEYVLNLLEQTRVTSRILLVNTYLMDLQNDPQGLVQRNDELKLLSNNHLDKQKAESLRWIRNPEITIQTASHMGSLPNVISHLIIKEKIDLVAMGNDGGSHVYKIVDLLKKLKCPLLITYQK